MADQVGRVVASEALPGLEPQFPCFRGKRCTFYCFSTTNDRSVLTYFSANQLLYVNHKVTDGRTCVESREKEAIVSQELFTCTLCELSALYAYLYVDSQRIKRSAFLTTCFTVSD